jgi:hypothetical protein
MSRYFRLIFSGKREEKVLSRLIKAREIQRIVMQGNPSTDVPPEMVTAGFADH